MRISIDVNCGKIFCDSCSCKQNYSFSIPGKVYVTAFCTVFRSELKRNRHRYLRLPECIAGEMNMAIHLAEEPEECENLYKEMIQRYQNWLSADSAE